MKNLKTCYLFLFLPFLLAASCGDDDMKTPEEEPSYETCCGTEPVTFTVGAAKVYVPNVFTTNSDGFNDVFTPFVNSHVSKIENLRITDESGDLLYSLPSYSLADPLDPVGSGGWLGTTVNDTTFYKGLFHYEMKVSDDTGQSAVIMGSACSVRCDSAAVIFQTKTGCLYPVQDNGQGGYDDSLPTFEEDCFNG